MHSTCVSFVMVGMQSEYHLLGRGILQTLGRNPLAHVYIGLNDLMCGMMLMYFMHQGNGGWFCLNKK